MFKKKKPTWVGALLIVSVIPAMALLRTTVFSNNKNTIASDNSTKYDIVADLGEGGRFESGEFSKRSDGKWVYKYTPSSQPTPIPKPVKDGYTFEGWTVDGDSTLKPDYTIPTWNRKDINLMAKWKSVEVPKLENILIDGPTFNSKIQNMSNFRNVRKVEFIYGSPIMGIDVSQAQDGGIRASITGDTLSIASDGDIYANENCWKLFSGFRVVKSFSFKNLDTTNVRNCAWMFDECAALTELNATKLDLNKCTNYSRMFNGCKSLTSITLKETLILSNVDNTSYMFNNCAKLSGELVVAGNVGEYTQMFSGCSTDANTEFWVKYSNKNLKSMAQQLVNTKHALTDHVYLYEEPKAILMDGRTFNATLNNMPDFRDVEEIRFIKSTPNPSGVNVAANGNIKAYISGNILVIASERKICANPDSQKMFSTFGSPFNAENNILKKIVFDNFDTSNVTNMYQMFSTCSKITSLDLRSFDTTNVTNMSEMFGACTSLTNLNVNSFDTSNVTTMSGMFGGCSILTGLDLSNFNTEKVTETRNMFEECRELTTLNISSFKLNNVRDMSDMFRNCFSVYRLDVHGFDTRYTANMSYMFAYCENLSSLDLSFFNTQSVADTSYMFLGCKKLTCTFTIMTSNCHNYYYMFGDAATSGEITVNYTPGCRSIAEYMVGTKFAESHVKLGREIPFPRVLKGKYLIEKQVKKSYLRYKPISLTLNNGTSAQYPKQVIEVENGKIPQLNPPELNPQYAGQFGGYYYDPKFTKPVKAGDVITQDITIYARW